MTDRKMTKSAGEHWVCSVLARYDWGAALTRDGLERTDILAVQTDGPERQAIEVQVKSMTRQRLEPKPVAARREVAAAGALRSRVVRAGHA